MPQWLRPDWPAPDCVQALQTMRGGGVSVGSFASLNLAAHVGDEPESVTANRRRLVVEAELPCEPSWMQQEHGCDVAEDGSPRLRGDAAVTRRKGHVRAVMTADCLPLLFCDRRGSVVGVAHAGWRGLARGVIEQCVARLRVPANEVLAWLGPAIGPTAFEVGAEVRAAFVDADPLAAEAFQPAAPGKYMADLYRLARQRLTRIGVHHVYGGEFCTYNDRGRYFSYRRDGVCGRMATLIWLAHD